MHNISLENDAKNLASQLEHYVVEKMNTESFINRLKPLLKEYRFKKTGSTWRRDQETSIAVFNIQKSRWGGEAFFINIGVYFKSLGNDLSPTHNKCHVQFRLDHNEPAIVVEEADDWFKKRDSLEKATSLAESDSSKGLVFREVRNRSEDT